MLIAKLIIVALSLLVQAKIFSEKDPAPKHPSAQEQSKPAAAADSLPVTAASAEE